ncbi:MAG: hypothetical protein R2759_09480 [Bacteroidales bacterium]
MSNIFRENNPQRSYTGKELSHYRKYKDILRIDFNRRCGYTDCPDFWFGGKTNFHIDHFLPKSKYPQLETVYNNLVYSNPFVNIAKKDDEGDYLDPVENDYNEHFFRDEFGNILPNNESEPAKYMYIKLKLYLKKYGIIWMLDNIDKKINLLSDKINGLPEADVKVELLQLYFELNEEFRKYKQYLEVELD